MWKSRTPRNSSSSLLLRRKLLQFLVCAYKNETRKDLIPIEHEWNVNLLINGNTAHFSQLPHTFSFLFLLASFLVKLKVKSCLHAQMLVSFFHICVSLPCAKKIKNWNTSPYINYFTDRNNPKSRTEWCFEDIACSLVLFIIYFLYLEISLGPSSIRTLEWGWGG